MPGEMTFLDRESSAEDEGTQSMARLSRLIPTTLPLAPRRSLALTLVDVTIRAGVWALLIFGLAAIVPMVLPAMRALQPRQPLPQGPVMDLAMLLSSPNKSVPLAVMFLLVIDLPIAYLCSNRVSSRQVYRKLMTLVPLGLGLIVGLGFVFLYIQTLTSLMGDVTK